MKHLTQKLLSAFLSLLLLFSYTAPVFALDVTTGGPVGQMPQSELSSGTLEHGQAKFEGLTPDTVFNIVFPTTTIVTSDGSTNGKFNFILDPHELIHYTQNNVEDDLSNWEYNNIPVDEGRLYFKNYETVDSGGQPVQKLVGLSRYSDDVMIYNKSTVAVNVAVSVEMASSSIQNQDFQFANTLDFRDLDGEVIDGPAMYMALVSGRRSAPILTQEVEVTPSVTPTPVPEGEEEEEVEPEYRTANIATINGWIANPNAYDVAWKHTVDSSGDTYNGYYWALKKDFTTLDKFTNMAFRMHGAINEDPAWDAVGKSMEVRMDIVWEVRTTQGTETDSRDPLDPSVLTVRAANKSGATALLDVDYGEGPSAMTKITQLVYTNASGKKTTVKMGTSGLKQSGRSVSLTAISSIWNGSNWALEFANADDTKTYLADFDLKNVSPETQVPIYPSLELTSARAKKPGEQVTYSLNYGQGFVQMAKIARVDYLDKDGNAATELTGPNLVIGGTDNTVATLTVTEDIYRGSGWKLVFATADDSNTYPIEIYPRSENGMTTDSVMPYLVSLDHGAMDVDDTVELTVNYGYYEGSRDKIVHMTVKTSEGEMFVRPSRGLTIDPDDKTKVSFTATRAIYTGSDWTLLFAKEDGSDTYPVKLDNIKGNGAVENLDVPPYITAVTQKVSNYDQTAVIRVNYGRGTEQRNTIEGINVYLNADSDSAIFVSAEKCGLIVDPDDNTKVSLTAIGKVYAGERWSLVFSEEGLKNSEAFLDDCGGLKASDAAPFDSQPPTATVIDPAMSVNDLVKLQVTYGTGALEKARVSKLTYTTQDGETRDIPAFNVEEDNTTVTFTAGKSIYAAQSWAVVFVDEEGLDPEPVSFTNLLGEGADDPNAGPAALNVEVSTPVTKGGQTLEMTVDFSESGMTKVTGMYYKQSGATSNSVIAADIDGEHVTAKIAPVIFNGHDWRLLLSNDDGTATMQMPINIKEADIYYAAKVNVTQNVTKGGQTLYMEVDFGESTMTKVTGMYYKQSGATSNSTITLSSISADYKNLSAKIAPVIFNGYDWRVLLSNEDGTETMQVPVNIKELS